MVLPAFAVLPTFKTFDKAVEVLLTCRTDYYLNGLCDMYSVWRAVELLTLVPWGLTEDDLRALVGGGTEGPTPLYVMKEILEALQPFIMEVASDGELVYVLKHERYRNSFRKLRNLGEDRAMAVLHDFIAILKRRKEFNEGGHINTRRLRLLPLLLKASEQTEEFEEFLADLGNIEMQLDEHMYFQLQVCTCVAPLLLPPPPLLLLLLLLLTL